MPHRRIAVASNRGVAVGVIRRVLEQSANPSTLPTCHLSIAPTSTPSGVPSDRLTAEPSKVPSSMPTNIPSGQPTTKPSQDPTSSPSQTPSSRPTSSQSIQYLPHIKVLPGGLAYLSEILYQSIIHTTTSTSATTYSYT